MKMYPNPNRFELHDQAKAVTSGLIDALTGWDAELRPVSHVWHANGFAVSSDAHQPHALIQTANGGVANLLRIEPPQVVAILRILGAPLYRDRQLTAIDRAFEWIPVAS